LPAVAPLPQAQSANPPPPQITVGQAVAPVSRLKLRPQITAVAPPKAAPLARVATAKAPPPETAPMPDAATAVQAAAVAPAKVAKAVRVAKTGKTAKGPPPAPPAPPPPPAETASADQHAHLPPHIYSVARQFGLQPDPDALPAQFFADQPGSDLAAPPPALPPRPVPGSQTVSSTAPENTPANRARAIALDTPSPDGSE
jgi:hypothetical protein